MKKECLHFWVYGYVADLIIYCKKCKKEADDVYSKKDFDYKTHKCKNGILIKSS